MKKALLLTLKILGGLLAVLIILAGSVFAIFHIDAVQDRLTANATQMLSDYLQTTVRIEKAKELLADLSLRIGDIAEQVGFLDMAHFSRVFKKMTGHSANEYRNLMQGRKR